MYDRDRSIQVSPHLTPRALEVEDCRTILLVNLHLQLDLDIATISSDLYIRND